MSNEVTDPTSADQMSDTPMDSPEKLDKGKGKMAAMEQDPMDDDEDESEEDEEGEGEPEGDPEDVDEDNMEEIDLDNIVESRTRGKNIDYAQAAKNLEEEDDEDDEDDDDFEDPDDKMMED